MFINAIFLSNIVDNVVSGGSGIFNDIQIPKTIMMFMFTGIRVFILCIELKLQVQEHAVTSKGNHN